MSFKQKLISTFTLVFAFAALTTFVSAQDNTTTAPQDSATTNMRPEGRGYGRRNFGREGRGDHGGKMMMGALSQLNLTEAQKTQIKSIMDANRTANQGTHEEMRGLMMKKRDGSITADEQTKLEGLKQQAKASADQTHSSILAILTPEQRTQLDQMKVQREQQMKERRQMRQNRQSAPPSTQN